MMKKLFKIFVSLLLLTVILGSIAFVFFPPPGVISVLMYRVIGAADAAAKEKNIVSRESFQRQMTFLHFFGYRVISLDDFYAIKTGQKKPRGKELVITFDAGNYSFDQEAFPILQKYSFPAAVFVVSESVEQGIYGSMREDTLKKLIQTGLITVGSNSKTHPFLSQMTDEQIKEELLGSKKDLEEMLQVPILYLSYPGGDLDSRVIQIAKDGGYRLAFTTSYKKLKGLAEGPYSLGRIQVTRSSDLLPVFWLKISGIYNSFKSMRYRWKNK